MACLLKVFFIMCYIFFMTVHTLCSSLSFIWDTDREKAFLCISKACLCFKLHISKKLYLRHIYNASKWEKKSNHTTSIPRKNAMKATHNRWLLTAFHQGTDGKQMRQKKWLHVWFIKQPSKTHTDFILILLTCLVSYNLRANLWKK